VTAAVFLAALVAVPAAARAQQRDLPAIITLYNQGKYHEALQSVDAYLERHPRNVEAMAWRGSIMGQLAARAKSGLQAARYGLGSISQLREALKLAPDNVTVLTCMAYNRLMTPKVYGQDVDAAMRFFRKALKLARKKETISSIHEGLALCYLEKKRRLQAVAELKLALAANPKNPGALKLHRRLTGYKPSATIEGIQLQGNELTSREYLLSGFHFKVGDVLDHADLDRTEQDWLATGYFEDFSLSVEPIHDDQHVVVKARIREQGAWDWGPYPLYLRHLNLFGRRHEAGAWFYLDKEWETEQIDLPYIRAILSYRVPSFLTFHLTLDAEAGYSFFPYITRTDRDPYFSRYHLHSWWARLSLSYRLGRWAGVGLWLTPRYFQMSDLDLGGQDPYLISLTEGEGHFDHSFTAFVKLRWPVRAAWPVTELSFLLEQTLGYTAMGSKHSYGKTRAVITNRWDLRKDLKLYLRLVGVTSVGTLPHWQRPAMGGDDGLRGYSVFHHVGDTYVMASMDLRWQAFTLLYGNMYFELFPLFDVGYIWSGTHELSTIPYDFGVGLNIYSAPGRTFRVRLCSVFNHHLDHLFFVTMVKPFEL